MAGDLRVTPESQVLTLRLPFGGAVWHRPTAVIVEHVDQAGPAFTPRGPTTASSPITVSSSTMTGVASSVQRLPIVDVTRVAQLAVVLVTLLVTVVCLIVSSRNEES